MYKLILDNYIYIYLYYICIQTLYIYIYNTILLHINLFASVI